jgi:hypothetical protein
MVLKYAYHGFNRFNEEPHCRPVGDVFMIGIYGEWQSPLRKDACMFADWDVLNDALGTIGKYIAQCSHGFSDEQKARLVHAAYNARGGADGQIFSRFIEAFPTNQQEALWAELKGMMRLKKLM